MDDHTAGAVGLEGEVEGLEFIFVFLLDWLVGLRQGDYIYKLILHLEQSFGESW